MAKAARPGIATRNLIIALTLAALAASGWSGEPAASQPGQVAPPPVAGAQSIGSPQWRGGPGRTGDFSGPAPLADSWPPNGPKLLWKTALPAALGSGSISVAGGRAYLAAVTTQPAQQKPSGSQTQPGPARVKMFDATNAMFCLDGETGAVVWKQEFPCISDLAFGAGGTPAIVDGRVYMTLAGTTERTEKNPQAFNGTVYCLDAASGKVIWQAEQDSTGAGFKGFGGLHSSPLVADGVCVVAGATVVAYEAATGKILWEQKCAGEAYASPALWRSGGQAYVLCNSKCRTAADEKKRGGLSPVVLKTKSGQPVKQGRAIYCLDLKTGAPQWAAAAPGAGLWDCGTPAIAGDVLIDQGPEGVTAIQLSAAKPAGLWFAPLPGEAGYFGPSPTVAGDYVYAVGREEIVCLKFAGGEPTGRLPILDPKRPINELYMCPAAANGMVVYTIATNDPKIPRTVVLARGGPEVRELARFPVPGLLEFTSPTLANGKLFLRLHEGAACYDLRAAAEGGEKRP